MSGFRAKCRHFPYIKQDSIAETRSTMESFLCKGYKKDVFEGVLTGFELHEIFVFVIIISVTEFS